MEAQLDSQFTLAHRLEMTLSVGCAGGYESGHKLGDQWMAALKLPAFDVLCRACQELAGPGFSLRGAGESRSFFRSFEANSGSIERKGSKKESITRRRSRITPGPAGFS